MLTFRKLSAIAILMLCLNSTFAAGKKGKTVEAPTNTDRSRFEKLELFNKVLFLIESQYYREVDTDKLISGAIRGMMNTLDPHSQFLDQQVFAKMQEDTKGEFGGLGIEVTQKDGVLLVITPIDDTPAFKAGIKAGDKIVEINHEPTIGLTLDEAVDRMRGKLGDKINIGIVREGSEGIKQFVLKREIIKIEAVKSELIDGQFSYVRLTQFQQGSAEQMIAAFKKHRKESEAKGGLKGIIFDLRSNPGGLLDEAVNVSSIFMKDGIVVSTEGRDPKQKEIRYVKKSGYKETEIPVVVLINGSSASASEIVSGALQDSKRAIIMGAQSFGKGSVQNLIKIDDQQGVKLTIAQYMTPLNRKIQAIGIVPDVQLDDFEAGWVESNRREGRYLREADLRNHLTATIETDDEKKAREKREYEDRKKRIEEIKKARSQKKSTAVAAEDDDQNRNIKPSEDYQVIQAVNYIRTIDVYESLKK